MNTVLLWAPYLLLAVLAIGLHLGLRRRAERRHADEQHRNAAAGLNEPPSLHPVVDPARCIGSGSCVRACPEGALGMVNGKATLINASACIGHGACHAACPFDAISLVFGTERRGIDIPLLSADFQTNVPGLYIAGELGGMGLIRKAAEQGRQAMEAMVHRLGGPSGEAQWQGACRTWGAESENWPQRAGFLPDSPAHSPAMGQEDGEKAAAAADLQPAIPKSDRLLDALIVGAGPAGLSAALVASEHGLNYQVIEQEPSLGGAIFHYPRQKIAMTAPVSLARVGRVVMTEISKEQLLTFWQGVVQRFALRLHTGCRMDGLTPQPDGHGFVVHTSQGPLYARTVLLAIGRRGSPRTLDVPGEDLPKVSYRLVDPAQYQGCAVLVVGGGDSALEAAIALADEPGTTVTLSYRGAAFSRVKAKNRDRLDERVAAGRLRLHLGSQVQHISPHSVSLRLADGQTLSEDNAAVIVCAGGVLPTPLLKSVGIQFETRHGEVGQRPG